ncbi:hypothetical protein CTA2_11205 [Colletotrichum tanaceti]|nr:hypothetical protein CTA2_11205 [Colletotrichum tanaceti]
MIGLDLRAGLGVVLVPVARRDGHLDPRVHGARQHGVVLDAFLAEAPGHVLGFSDLWLESTVRPMLFADPPPPCRAWTEACKSKKREASRTKSCLLHVYAIPATAPEVPAVLAMLTMAPDFFSLVKRITARIILTGTVRLTAVTRSHSVSVKPSTLLKLFITPTALTSKSIRTPIFVSLPARFEIQWPNDERNASRTKNRLFQNQSDKFKKNTPEGSDRHVHAVLASPGTIGLMEVEPALIQASWIKP